MNNCYRKKKYNIEPEVPQKLVESMENRGMYIYISLYVKETQ